MAMAREQHLRFELPIEDDDDKWVCSNIGRRGRFVSEASTTCSDHLESVTGVVSDRMESFANTYDCLPSWTVEDLEDTETMAPSEDGDNESRFTSKPSIADSFLSRASSATPSEGGAGCKVSKVGLDERPQKELVVRACTWNLFGRPVSEHDELEQWLVHSGAVDILAVGVQELVELKPKTAIRDCCGNQCRISELEAHVEGVLHRGPVRYHRLCSVGMVGLALVVYVRQELVGGASRPECMRIRTGFSGVVGNKGAVCARVKVAGLSACFVNVHLPSGEGRVKAEKRDRHLCKVLTKAARSQWSGAWVPSLCRGDTAAARTPSDQLSLQHGLVVVLGDFNSRRCHEADRPLRGGAKAAGLACEPAADEHDERLHDDELINGMFGSGLTGFQEGAVDFAPTFGYVPGSDSYDPRRRPCWTDRVVFRASRGAQAALEGYGAFQEMRHTSDHRPVAAQLRVSL